jgi:D-serine deaminase-like pyridoxal phosphate-dependent protein
VVLGHPAHHGARLGGVRPTPALVLDPDALAANLARMARACRADGVALRPHVKGHKSPAIAAQQGAAGAVGVAAATLAEAAAMVDGGVGDVLLTSVLPPAMAEDAVALAGRAERLTLVVHDPALVAALDAAAAAAGAVLDVLIDLDVGQRRGGVSPGAAALALAALVGAAGALELRGVQGYEGHLQAIEAPDTRAAASAEAMAVLAACVAELRAAGHAVAWVTTAGTGTAAFAAPHPVVTEVQPGSYALMDAAYARVGGLAFAQAVWVEASVLAVLSPEEVIVDAGLKALSVDMGPAEVAAPLAATYAPAGDEHGRLTGALGAVAVGDRVRLIPSHSDTTVLLHGAFHLPDGSVLAVAR